MRTNLKLVSLILVVLLLAGCTSTEIADSFSVAEQALTATAAILQPVNPVLAAALTIGGTAVKSAYDTYSIYASAAPEDKATAAGRARTAINAAQQNLAQILAAAKIKNPELVTYVTAYVAVANTVLTLIYNHLPKTGTAAFMVAPNLPVVQGAKSANDLKKFFNSQVPPGSQI